MSQERVVNVSYPRKKEFPKPNPLIVVILISILIGLAWFLFFRGKESTEQTPKEAVKKDQQKVDTPSAKANESTGSAKPTPSKLDTTDWSEYTDVKETFSVLIPKGWFFDRTAKGEREQGKVLGGVANFNFIEKKFDPEKNFAVYFERDSLTSDIPLKKYAARIACIRADGDNCEDPETPKTQKSLKVGDKNSIWQEIHKEKGGIGIEVYIPKTETEVYVLYTKGKVSESEARLLVEQEFVNIVEAIIATFKFLR